MNYQIETKQTVLLKGITFSSKKDVVNTIKMFDLKPPFKVVDNQKNNVTGEFISILEQDGYQFIDINQVIKNIPISLQKVMNTFYNRTMSFLGIDSMPIQLVSVKDIKSIFGFYELWDNKGITIGKSNNDIVFFDTNSKAICKISVDSIKDFATKKVIFSSVDEFIKLYKKNVN